MIITLKIIAILTPVFTTFFWASVLILRNNSRKNPGFYIAFLMFCFFLVFISILPYYTDNYRSSLALAPLFYLALLLIFPLVYFYVRFVASRIKPDLRDLLHFSPAILISLWQFCYLLFIKDPLLKVAYGTDLPNTIDKDNPLWITLPAIISRIIFIAQIIFYYILSIREIKEHKKKISNYFSDLNKYYFNWIRLFFWTYPLASMLGLYLLIMGNAGIDRLPESYFSLALFFLSAVFYMISYIANHQRYIENGEFYKSIQGKEVQVEKLHLPPGLKEKLKEYFTDEKPYLDPDLKITDVASWLNTNRTYISHLVRQAGYSNFSHFVNQHRIKEAVNLFNEAAYRNYTTRSISEMAGFNNYNSFTNAFRLFTGKTPAAYRNKIMA